MVTGGVLKCLCCRPGIGAVARLRVFGTRIGTTTARTRTTISGFASTTAQTSNLRARIVEPQGYAIRRYAKSVSRLFLVGQPKTRGNRNGEHETIQ